MTARDHTASYSARLRAIIHGFREGKSDLKAASTGAQRMGMVAVRAEVTTKKAEAFGFVKQAQKLGTGSIRN